MNEFGIDSIWIVNELDLGIPGSSVFFNSSIPIEPYRQDFKTDFTENDVHISPEGIVTHPVIKTPYGFKQITRFEKPSENAELGGLALPDFNTYIVNPKSVFPKGYVDFHERDHLRDYELTGIDLIDEDINRELADEKYNKITGEHIDTVTPYEGQMEEDLIERYGEKDAREAMDEVRKIKDKYVSKNRNAVDLDFIRKEYEEDLKREQIVKEKMKESQLTPYVNTGVV